MPARTRRPVEDSFARHARGGPGVDRDEAEETPRLPRAARRLYGVHTRFAQTAELAVDRVVRRAAHHPPLRHARHPRRGRLPGAGHGRAELALSGGGAEDEGREMPRVRQLRADQEGRLGRLQRVRLGGGVRVASRIPPHGLKGLRGTPTAVTTLAEYAPKKRGGRTGEMSCRSSRSGRSLWCWPNKTAGRSPAPRVA